MRTNSPKEQVDKSTVKRLFSYMLNYKSKFIIVCICIVLSGLVFSISANSIRILIDDIITPLSTKQNPDFSGLLLFIILLGMVYLVGVISTLLYTRLMVDVAQGTMKKIRDDMFIHMQKLPIKYFDTNSTGDLMSHYTNDIDTLRQVLTQSIPQSFSSLITIISVFATMLFTSLYLTIIVIITLAIMLYLVKNIAIKSSKYFNKQQAAIGDLNGYIEEMIHGQKVIKVFSHEEKAKEEFDMKNEVVFENSYSANTFANILMPMMNNLGILQYIILAIIGGYFAINHIGGITLGVIAAFLILSRNLNMPIGQISQQINSVIMGLAGAKRIFRLLDQEVEKDSGFITLVNAKEVDGKIVETEKRTGVWAWKLPNNDGSFSYQKLEGEVHLKNVFFGYNEEKMVLKDISLYAKPGQKIALVGATGAGKTTITNLINRFYNINSGEITYDHINISDIKKEDLRKSLGVVLQDTNLFTASVLENIRYGNLDATDEECIEAAKKANAHYFIELLKDGYQTVISGDGEGLSQGQRQLLSIARAIVANPPVMILDEATSSIDTHTEAVVQRGMDQLMKGRTVFVIAHRLSTIKNSDLIVVLDQGQIIEKGNHDELIEKKGTYYQLYTGAFEEVGD